jgi:hypothetical protein
MIGETSRTLHVEILGVLLLILVASWTIFALLVRRWTTQRRLHTLLEWGSNAGFKVITADRQQLVRPLQALQSHGPQIELQLASEDTVILRVLCPPAAPSGARQPAAEYWNLLVRWGETSWKPAGLRPSHARRSIVDFFSLSSFSTAGGLHRFTLFAAGSDAKNGFPDSIAQAILPPDVGLLVSEGAIVLDFSGRPFDDLEFNRMVALAAELQLKLVKRQPA